MPKGACCPKRACSRAGCKDPRDPALGLSPFCSSTLSEWVVGAAAAAAAGAPCIGTVGPSVTSPILSGLKAAPLARLCPLWDAPPSCVLLGLQGSSVWASGGEKGSCVLRAGDTTEDALLVTEGVLATLRGGGGGMLPKSLTSPLLASPLLESAFLLPSCPRVGGAGGAPVGAAAALLSSLAFCFDAEEGGIVTTGSGWPVGVDPPDLEGECVAVELDADPPGFGVSGGGG